MPEKIYYANAVYDQKEIQAVNKVLKNHLTLMDGPLVKNLIKLLTSLEKNMELWLTPVLQLI